MKNLLLLTIIILFSISITTAQEAAANTDKETVAKDDRGYILEVGDDFPAFEMTLTDGSVIGPEDMDGKVIMLQFTASWCSVCRKEMPFIEKEIWQLHQDNEDFLLVGIDKDEPLEKVLPFIEQTAVTYPIALDPGAEIFQLFAGPKAGVTRNIIVDKNGKIKMLTRLFERTEFDEMKEVINELLEE